MKKIVFVALIAVFGLSTANAQDVKKAKKLFLLKLKHLQWMDRECCLKQKQLIMVQ